MDELTVYRQRKCAESKEGHRWSFPQNGISSCEKCEMTIRRTEKRSNADF